MTVYEQELRKLFEHSDLVDRPQFSGRVCVGDLGKDLRVRAEFLSTHISSQYDAIRLTVLNRTEGGDKPSFFMQQLKKDRETCILQSGQYAPVERMKAT